MKGKIAGAFLTLTLCGCAGAGASGEHLAAPVPVPAGVILNSSVYRYPISGANVVELRRAMLAAAPTSGDRKYPGVTHSRIGWVFTYERNGLQCLFRDVRVNVEARVEVPKFTPTANTDTAVTRWWSQFDQSLMTHELGHVKIAIEGAKKVREQLRGMSANACDVLGNNANDAGRRIVAQTSANQVKYDADTHHGATQSTVQPVRR